MGMYAPFSFPIAEDMVTCVVLWPMKRCLFHLHDQYPIPFVEKDGFFCCIK